MEAFLSRDDKAGFQCCLIDVTADASYSFFSGMLVVVTAHLLSSTLNVGRGMSKYTPECDTLAGSIEKFKHFTRELRGLPGQIVTQLLQNFFSHRA